ncbi:uncharacterized protein NPIL_504991 [Nephila pilipes]|uniref:Uncharacterized protein n=1 Tax=Nephila pilipes TaxID=299642 RepID=A0A8X6QZC3_NEPPI|nr:uncharacterized protein NPIL_504991 [Nephila pilipes]
MPHTTSSEVVSPSLGAIATVDVWDDPRSLRTFSTFHQSNGKNNKTCAETSFHTSPKANHTNDSQQNGNVEEVKANGIDHWNNGSENGNGSSSPVINSVSKNNLVVPFPKPKTSPKFGKLVKPVVTPPLKLNQKLKVDHSNNNDSFDNTQKDQSALSSFGSILSNGVKKADTGQVTPLTNFLQSTLNETNGNENNPPKENGTNAPEEGNDVVTINLGPTDKRFGFSVVGGCDEGFVPRIENITPGMARQRKYSWYCFRVAHVQETIEVWLLQVKTPNFEKKN